MNASTPLYLQLLGFFSQYSRVRDWRHLKTLGWMVSALIGSGKLSLPAWEQYVTSQATQAQSFERRWRRFLIYGAIEPTITLYVSVDIRSKILTCQESGDPTSAQCERWSDLMPLMTWQPDCLTQVPQKQAERRKE